MPGPTFTYNFKPSSNSLMMVRFLIQDTDETAPLLYDGEIESIIETETASNPTFIELLSTAAECMEALAQRFAAQADTSLGSLQLTYSKQAAGYAKRAKALRLRAQGSHGPMSGGQLTSEKEARENETGRTAPTFKRHQFDIPYRGPSTSPWPANQNTEEER